MGKGEIGVRGIVRGKEGRGERGDEAIKGGVLRCRGVWLFGGITMYFYPPTIWVGEPRNLLSALPDEVFDCVVWEAYVGNKHITENLLAQHPTREVVYALSRRKNGPISFVYRSIVPYLHDVRRLMIDVGTCAIVGSPQVMPYVRVACDPVFGMENFANEIVWAFSRRMRPATRWENWHNTIYLYAKDIERQYVNLEGVDRMSVRQSQRTRRLLRTRGAEYAEIGRAPSDVWLLALPRRGAATFGYHGRPMLLYKRLIHAHSVPGSMVLSLFDVTGVSLRAAVELGRSCILVLPSPNVLEKLKESLFGLDVRILGDADIGVFAA